MEKDVLGSIDQHFEDREGIASCKSLSVAFGWSLKEAQSNLKKYMNKHPQLKPVFCVEGFRSTSSGGWEYIVRLTTSADGHVHEDLINSTVNIYSLHRGETTNPVALACFDKSIDQDPTTHPELVSFPWKPCKPSAPAARPQPVPENRSPAKTKPTSSNAAIASNGLPPIWTSIPAVKRQSIKRQLKTRPQSSLKFEAKKSEPAKKPTELQPVSDPFADSEEEDLFDDESENLHIKRRRVVFSSDEEEMGTNKYARGAKVVEKVQEAVVKSSSSHSSAASSRKSEQNHKSSKRGEVAKKTKVITENGKEKKRKKEHAGERPREDEGDDEEAFRLAPADGVKLPQPTSSSRPSTTRRRRVTKTFMDDEGFLVTEKVWEDVEVSADEVVEAEPPPPSTTESKTGSPPKVKTTHSGPKKVKQTTLGSFFKL